MKPWAGGASPNYRELLSEGEVLGDEGCALGDD
jgi:hypothetical protein